MNEANPLAHLAASIPAETIPEKAKQIHWINTRTGWQTNGERCSFCHEFLRRNRQGGFSCFTCSPEQERLKLIKIMRKKVRMVIRIE